MDIRILRLLQAKFPDFGKEKLESPRLVLVDENNKKILADKPSPNGYSEALRHIALSQSSKQFESEALPLLRDMISQDANFKYQKLLEEIKHAAKDDDANRVLVDIDENEELALKIETWIKETFCKGAKTEDFAPEKISEANQNLGNAWLAFYSLISIQNLDSMLASIDEFLIDSKYLSAKLKDKRAAKDRLVSQLKRNFKLSNDEAQELSQIHLLYKPIEREIEKFSKWQNFDKKDYLEQADARKKFIKDILNQYPIDENDLKILFDTKVSLKEGKSAKEVFLDINNRYGVWKDHKKSISAYLGYQFLADTLQMAGPVAMASASDLSYGLAAFLSLGTISAGVRSLSSKQFVNLTNELKKKVNQDITAAVFYGGFEDLSNHSFGKIFDASEKGKAAVINTVRDALWLPSLAYQPLGSLALLLSISPWLAMSNIFGIGATLAISSSFGAKTKDKHQDEISERESAAKSVDQIMRAMQEIRLSPQIAKMEAALKDKKNQVDDIDLMKSFLGINMSLSNNVAVNSSLVGTALLGGLLKIPAQSLMSVFMYTGQVLGPIVNAFERLTATMNKDVHDVSRLHQVIGNREDLVRPNSKIEQDKKSVLELKNHKIEIKDLNYKGILKGIDLDINEGEFVSIVGPSGVGKSTLLKNILGLLKPDSGKVMIGGFETKDIKKYDPKASLYNIVAYCDQKPSIIQGMTLRENMLLGLENVEDGKIIKVMQELGLYKEGVEPDEEYGDPTLINKTLDQELDHDFSGGQKVRVGLARALLRGAKILLLDEPCASLDKDAKRKVRQQLSKLHRDRSDITIICVTHDENLIEESQRFGRSIDLSSSVKSPESFDDLVKIILDSKPEKPEDPAVFLRDELSELTDGQYDFYDLRRIIKQGSKFSEEESYAAKIWE